MYFTSYIPGKTLAICLDTKFVWHLQYHEHIMAREGTPLSYYLCFTCTVSTHGEALGAKDSTLGLLTT